MKLDTYPAVEPLWPYGTVAFFYIKAKGDEHAIGVRELVVEAVEPIEGGWRVIAGLQNTSFDPEGRRFVFEVDSDGESASCVPWDDDLEEEFNAPRRPFTEAAGTVPVRLSEPTFREGETVYPVFNSRYSEPGTPPAGDVWEVFDPETRETRQETFNPDDGWTIKASAPPAEWKEMVSSGLDN